MILSTSFATATASPLAIAIGAGAPDAPPVFGALLGEAANGTTVAPDTAPVVPGLTPAPPPLLIDRQADALPGTPLPPAPAQPPLAPTVAWRSSTLSLATATPQSPFAASPLALPTPATGIAKPVSAYAARRAPLAPTLSPIVRDDTAEKPLAAPDSAENWANDPLEPAPDQANPPPAVIVAVLAPSAVEPPPHRAETISPAVTTDAGRLASIGGGARAPATPRSAPTSGSPSATASIPPAEIGVAPHAPTSRHAAPASVTSLTPDDAAPVMRSSDAAALERPLSAPRTAARLARPSAAEPLASAASPIATLHQARANASRGVSPSVEPGLRGVPAPAKEVKTTASIVAGSRRIPEATVNTAERIIAIAPRAPALSVSAATGKNAGLPAAAPLPTAAPEGPTAEIGRPQAVRASNPLPSMGATDVTATVVAPTMIGLTDLIPPGHAVRGDGRIDRAASTVGAATPPPAAVPPPVTALPITQGPAIQVFGAAIAAARRNDRGIADDRTIAPATLQPIADAAHPMVAAIGGAQQAPLDLRQDRWPHAMIDRIEHLRDTAAAATAGAADTRIRLIPDALGTIDVSITREGDAVTVRFQAEHAGTRALLQDSQARLADIAESRGLRLSGSSVDAGSAGTGQQQRAPQQHPTLPNAPRRAPTRDSATVDDADAGRVA